MKNPTKNPWFWPVVLIAALTTMVIVVVALGQGSAEIGHPVTEHPMITQDRLSLPWQAIVTGCTAIALGSAWLAVLSHITRENSKKITTLFDLYNEKKK